MQGEINRVIDFKNQASKQTDEKKKKELLENASYWEKEVEGYQKALQGRQPPSGMTKGDTVVLDFDSGHYQPSGTWKISKEAWNQVGYKVKWSHDARHV